MGTREKLFRQKLADQIESLLTKSEKVFSSEKLDNEWLNSMLAKTHEVSSALSIYQFLHDLPENEKLQVEFLELMDEEESKKTEPEAPNYGDEILKEIDEFETQESVEVFEVTEEEVVSVSLENSERLDLSEEVTEEPIVEETEKEEFEAETEEEIVEVEEIDVEVGEATEVEVVAEEEKVLVSESETEESITELNDTVASDTPSLADKLSNKSIKKLADTIALNERFLFSNELFNGNMEAFKRALTELDHIASKEDANRYIEKQLKEENNWSMESETVQSFVTLVERRFN